jgi:elongation factor G
MALEPRSGSEAPLLSRALAEIVRDDPSLRVDEEADSGRLRLSGLGELHLEIALSRLQREFGLSPRSGAPEVALKESVSAKACAEAVFDREIDYKRHYAKVRLSVSPGERGSGLSISSSVEATRRQTRVFSEAALRGASQVLETGPRFGYSATDIALELTGIEADPRDSSELAFEAAGAIAVRFAVSDAKPIILEPWMRLELGLPEEHLGLVIQALTGRQGRIEEIEDVPGGKVVSAVVAMRELFGLAGELRSRARGRIILSQAFHSFQAIPQHLYDRAASGKRVSG